MPGHTLSPPSFTSEGDPSQAAAIGVQVGRMSVPRCRRDGRQHGAVALQFRTGAAASRFHCPQPPRNPVENRPIHGLIIESNSRLHARLPESRIV